MEEVINCVLDDGWMGLGCVYMREVVGVGSWYVILYFVGVGVGVGVGGMGCAGREGTVIFIFHEPMERWDNGKVFLMLCLVWSGLRIWL